MHTKKLAEMLERLRLTGSKLYRQLQVAINHPDGVSVSLPTLSDGYSHDIESGLQKYVSKPTLEIIEANGFPRNGYDLFQINGSGEYAYENYIHSDGKAILCVYNFAKSDRYYKKPQKMPWIQMMSACCVLAMKRSGGDIAKLEAVWRVGIVNTETRSVIEHMLRRETNQRFVETNQRSAEVSPSDDVFYSLLGTDNGRGVAGMLAKYPQVFGRKNITRARVYKTQETRQHASYCICWFLEEVPRPQAVSPSPPGPLSRKQKRWQKRKTPSGA
ncbi:hypothetical protein QBC46DRAFT_342490 [Diplogelasinospora grovesii]|uniref:Uncharacterized protein n=1 Tax=Diplogelasinospora grovesii TaxID=303347 RepID=A0AAN6N653_9PEZI|nr:hypothetical protein QBC46DRAFT_342490 [Diplogelasinospora grovesii]